MTTISNFMSTLVTPATLASSLRISSFRFAMFSPPRCSTGRVPSFLVCFRSPRVGALPGWEPLSKTSDAVGPLTVAEFIHPLNLCNFVRTAAYCLMDAERNNAKGSQPEGKATHMDGPDLENVIQRARGHDAEALGEIYRLYARRVFGLCRYMLDSRENAEDATSEVFLKLQRSIGSYDGSTPFLRWLLRVAGNQCIDALRSRKRGRQVIVEVEEGVIEAASPEPSPLGAVLSTEERTKVRDAIALLPENYRVPLVLRYYSELSYDEIAQQLGLKRDYVAALLFRAKQELRRKLGQGSK